jgi:chitin disaccharide deacetylase
MSRTMVLCADDFGMSDGINRAILELIARGRLSAVSCMTGLATWSAAARALTDLRGRAAVGLHFTLTAGPEAWTLSELMRASLLRRLSVPTVAAALERQLDAFEQAMGRAPDFVDGHEHVQSFPQVRDALAGVLAGRYPDWRPDWRPDRRPGRRPGRRPWVRVPRPRLGGHDAPLKAAVLRAIGAGFDATLRRAGLPRTRAFAGLYSLGPRADFPRLMAAWLRDSPDGALIMCHPGCGADEAPLARVREAERAYLAGPGFADALAAADVRLATRPALATCA